MIAMTGNFGLNDSGTPSNNLEDGFIFSTSALGVSLILAVFVFIAMDAGSLNITMAEQNLSTIKASNAAISGINLATRRMETMEVGDVAGSWDFDGCSVIITTTTSDRSGDPMEEGYLRVVSTSSSGSSNRNYDVVYHQVVQSEWPETSMLMINDDNEEEFKNDFHFDGTLYVAKDLLLKNEHIGQDGGAHFLHPASAEIQNDDDKNNYTEETVAPMSFPLMTFPHEDSLLAVTETIGSTEGNRIKGDYKPTGITLDLRSFDNNTLFVNGSIELKNIAIPSCETADPCFLVAKKDIKTKADGGNGCIIGDNVIFIGGGHIHLENLTQFGTDYSALPLEERPIVVNELYSPTCVTPRDDAIQTWAQCINPFKQVKVKGILYGVIYCPGISAGLEWDKDKDNLAEFYGAMYVGELKQPSDFESSKIKITGHNMAHFTSTQGSYVMVPGSISEF